MSIRSSDRVVFNILIYTIVTIVAIVCLFPFVMLVSASFSDEWEILRTGYSLFPKGFNLEDDNN